MMRLNPCESGIAGGALLSVMVESVGEIAGAGWCHRKGWDAFGSPVQLWHNLVRAEPSEWEH